MFSRSRRSSIASWSAWAVLAAAVATGVAVVWRYDPRTWNLPLCGFHAITGLHCPGCGATRAVHELLHGRVLSALRYNALLGPAMLIAGWAAAFRIRCWRRRQSWPIDRLCPPWAMIAGGLAVLIFGLLRNVPLYPLTLLAPPG